LLYPSFIPRALFCLDQTTKPRSWCLVLVTGKWFERLSMTIILLNCLTLGMYEPCIDRPVCTTTKCHVLQYFDHFIYAFFIFEISVKIIAMGFIGKNTYMAEAWNVLDFLIIIAGTTEYMVDDSKWSMSAIRTFRVLRPLRAINRIPSMRILVMLLLDTMPMLGNVLLLCFFVFFIFGIVGVQLWSGLLRNRCFLNLPPNVSTGELVSFLLLPDPYSGPNEEDFICSKPSDEGMTKCSEIPNFVFEGITCNETAVPNYNLTLLPNGFCVNWNQYYSSCKTGLSNPFKGSISFDNIGLAWVAIFQVISLEGWVDIMYYIQDAHSFWDWMYFVALIVIGAFFMINLCLVVIATQFAETKKRETEKMIQERMYQRSSNSSSSLDASDGEPVGCYLQLIRCIAHSLRKNYRKTRKYLTLKPEERCVKLEALPTRKLSIKSPAFLIVPAVKPRSPSFQQYSLARFSSASGQTPLQRSSPKHSLPQSRIYQQNRSPQFSATYNPRQSHARRMTEVLKNSENEMAKDVAHLRRGCCFFKIRKLLQRFVDSKYFQRGILLAILINSISMGIEHDKQHKYFTSVLENFNIFFATLFGVEMILKLLAHGVCDYLQDGFNAFDGFIVIVSVMELFYRTETAGLSVLRTFRLLRILKLVRFLPALRYQLLIMLKTMDNVATFFALLCLFIFIFSILGMNIFGCKLCSEKSIRISKHSCGRKNFDSLLWAVVTVFQILTQEDWNEVLYTGMSMTSAWASLYFIALMTFGNYVLFNLLVAILVEGFSAEGEERMKEDSMIKAALKDMKKKSKKKREIEIENAFNLNVDDASGNSASGSGVLKVDNYLQDDPSIELSSARVHFTPQNLQTKLQNNQQLQQILLQQIQIIAPRKNEIKQRDQNLEQTSSLKSLQHNGIENLSQIKTHLQDYQNAPQPPNNNTQQLQQQYQQIKLLLPQQKQQQPHQQFSKICQQSQQQQFKQQSFNESQLSEYAFYLLPPSNKFRQFCLWFISQQWFDYCILLCIAFNCITLAMERPDIPPDSIERLFLTTSNYVFTVIFAFEMLVKVSAKGMLFHEHAYLKSGWNIMDGSLVFISLVDIVVSLIASTSTRIFGILRVFRLLRALKPLRVISRAPGLKLVVSTLLSSLRPIGNIVLICCTFFIIFGILGVQLFKGTFYYCDGPNVSSVKNKTDCTNMGPPYRWINRKYNFDNLGQALMSLFVLASRDGWVNIMYTGLDAVGVDQQPQVNYNEWRLLYFISFLLLVGFFVLNMFVGVVVENFHKCRETQEKEEKSRRADLYTLKMIKKRKRETKILFDSSPAYWCRYSKSRMMLHAFINSKYFDLVSAGVIGLNVIMMALEYYLMPDELTLILKCFNYFFTSVFMIEALAKLISLGGVRYLKDRWNQLDVVIVILSVAGIILDEVEFEFFKFNPTIMRVIRVLRIARVLKLLKMAKAVRALLDTVMQALPEVGNLGLLFFLLFFIFAALGVELFGRVECSVAHPCEGLNKHAHFRNFGMAFLTLFRVATGDNWNGIMKDALKDDCDGGYDCVQNCCVSNVIAPMFFVIFVLMAQFVLVNVVVAVLMKHLE
ncbi:hypothetical protein HELRODRAFT_148954, partial [Helobdella robusta]|uniref:Ion transport domain-containing protein n=1 Tax=Helobdella robusta TaxID=6412 RepID=T1EKC2_HELRO